MRKEYDFSAARKNPYAAQLKKQITIRLDEESITYFKSISGDVVGAGANVYEFGRFESVACEAMVAFLRAMKHRLDR